MSEGLRRHSVRENQTDPEVRKKNLVQFNMELLKNTYSQVYGQESMSGNAQAHRTGINVKLDIDTGRIRYVGNYETQDEAPVVHTVSGTFIIHEEVIRAAGDFAQNGSVSKQDYLPVNVVFTTHDQEISSSAQEVMEKTRLAFERMLRKKEDAFFEKYAKKA